MDAEELLLQRIEKLERRLGFTTRINELLLQRIEKLEKLERRLGITTRILAYLVRERERDPKLIKIANDLARHSNKSLCEEIEYYECNEVDK